MNYIINTLKWFLKSQIYERYQIHGLAWKVGNELRVRLGVDPWMGSEGKHLLSNHLIHSLRLKGLVSLNSLANHPSTTLWAQGWKSANDLDLNVEESVELESYLTSLKTL
jgi:hypothetical protein